MVMLFRKLFLTDYSDSGGGIFQSKCVNFVANQLYNHIKAENLYLILETSLKSSQKKTRLLNDMIKHRIELTMQRSTFKAKGCKVKNRCDNGIFSFLAVAFDKVSQFNEISVGTYVLLQTLGLLTLRHEFIDVIGLWRDLSHLKFIYFIYFKLELLVSLFQYKLLRQATIVKARPFKLGHFLSHLEGKVMIKRSIRLKYAGIKSKRLKNFLDDSPRCNVRDIKFQKDYLVAAFMASIVPAVDSRPFSYHWELV